MGSWHAGARLAEMIARLPGDAVLCLDEAYADFAPPDAGPPIDPHEPRVIRMRTFSKAHGMAGVRVGYAIAHPELSPPSTGSATTSASAASPRPARSPPSPTATGSPTSSPRSRRRAPASRRSPRRTACAPLPSATNFVTIDCGRDGAFARAVLNGLVARGVFVRMPFVAPQDRCIRVTVGRAEDLAAFAAALPEALAAAG